MLRFAYEHLTEINPYNAQHMKQLKEINRQKNYGKEQGL